MRGKRAKQYRKAMHAYAMSFNFREPYQILLDADIIRDAARFKMKLGSLLENTVGGTIKPMITQCCIRQLYDAEVEPEEKAEKEQWIEVAKQAERRKCGHHELVEPLSPLECIQSVLDPKSSGTNRHRYIVASQDPEIRATMRQIPGVPLIYINRSVMILEPLAAKTEARRDAEEVSKRKAGLRGRPSLAAGEKRKRDDDEEELDAKMEQTAKKRKAKGPKAPNPLSVKKAKKPAQTQPAKKTVDAEEETTLPAAKSKEQRDTAADQVDAESVPGDGTAPKRKRKRKTKAGLTMDGEVDGRHDDDGDGDD